MVKTVSFNIHLRQNLLLDTNPALKFLKGLGIQKIGVKNER